MCHVGRKINHPICLYFFSSMQRTCVLLQFLAFLVPQFFCFSATIFWRICLDPLLQHAVEIPLLTVTVTVEFSHIIMVEITCTISLVCIQYAGYCGSPTSKVLKTMIMYLCRKNPLVWISQVHGSRITSRTGR